MDDVGNYLHPFLIIKDMSKDKKLTPKQKRFCEEYVVDSNGKQAAIRAGYSEKTAEVQASRLLTLVKVKTYVQKLQAKTAKKLELKREDIINELLDNIAFYNKLKKMALNDDLDDDQLFQFERLSNIIKASDSNKAIDLLLKANGWNEAEKQIIEHKGLPPLFPDVDYDK